jgi:predicted HAD superfamily hydrolase
MSDASDAFDIIRFSGLQDELYNCENRLLMFQDADFCRQLTETLETGLADRRAILSLDVFDTLLLRDNSSEFRRFYEIAEKMAAITVNASTGSHPRIQVTPIDAFIARHLGTKATYRATDRVEGVREGSLEDIHRVAVRLLHLPESVSGEFIEAEINYEATRLTINPFLISYLASLKSKRVRTILVSDMYFRACHLKSLLSRVGLDPSIFDAIYSSGDEKISKSSGLLFKKIAIDFPDAVFFHVGDNLKSDFHMPRIAGWSALHLPISDYDLAQRRRCHNETAAYFSQSHGITIDIHRP